MLLIRANVASGGKYSPASTLCQYRVLRPVLSAICSWVIASPRRMPATFLPNRIRLMQWTGFFDGIHTSSPKENHQNTRLDLALLDGANCSQAAMNKNPSDISNAKSCDDS